MPVSAEHEYWFTHSVLRQAAYDMQQPVERAELHGLALQVMEELFPRVERGTIARAIARHAAEAFRGGTLPPAAAAPDVIAETELRGLRAAAQAADANYDVREAASLWLQVAGHDLVTPADRFSALMNASEALRHQGRLAEARQCLNDAKPLSPDDSALLRCLVSQANIQRLMGEPKEAEARARMALDSARAPDERAHAAGTLARVLRDIGKGDEAEALFNESMALHSGLGDELSEAKIAGGLAAFLSERGRNDDAEALYRRALELHRHAGDLRGEAIYLGNLGILYTEAARYDEAEACYREALDTHRQLGNRTDEAIVCGNYAILLKTLGRLQEAELNYRRTLNVLREQGNRPLESRYLGNLANLLDDTGRTVQAVGMYEMALGILRSINQPRMLGATLGNLGLARQKLGRIDEAYTALSEGIQLLIEQEARLPAGAFLALRGELFLLLGEIGSAETDLLEAEALLKDESAKAYRIQFLLPLKVRMLAHQGDIEAAEDLVAAGEQDFATPGSDSELGKAIDTARRLVKAARDGALLNGHIPVDIPRELRRAVADRLRKSAPDVAQRLNDT